MTAPANLPLVAPRRAPFVSTLAFLHRDWTGATFALQVRDRKDGGMVRADLETVGSAAAEGVRLIYGGSATVAAHVAAGRLTADEVAKMKLEAGDTLELSLVGIRINETTMEAMPPGTEIGNDAAIWWDMHVTPSGGVKQVPLGGAFTVAAGVTE